MLCILVSGFTKPDFLWSYIYRNLKEEKVIIFKYKFWEDLNISIEELNLLIKNQRDKYPEIDQVAVIGHSMGGLIARCSSADLVVTIATPHGGTYLADLGLLGPLGVISASQMGTSCEFIRRNNQERKTEGKNLPTSTPLMCLRAEYDLLVLPSSSAFVEGADNKTIKGVGHTGILSSSDTLEAIEDFLHLHRR